MKFKLFPRRVEMKYLADTIGGTHCMRCICQLNMAIPSETPFKRINQQQSSLKQAQVEKYAHDEILGHKEDTWHGSISLVPTVGLQRCTSRYETLVCPVSSSFWYLKELSHTRE